MLVPANFSTGWRLQTNIVALRSPHKCFICHVKLLKNLNLITSDFTAIRENHTSLDNNYITKKQQQIPRAFGTPPMKCSYSPGPTPTEPESDPAPRSNVYEIPGEQLAKCHGAAIRKLRQRNPTGQRPSSSFPKQGEMKNRGPPNPMKT